MIVTVMIDREELPVLIWYMAYSKGWYSGEYMKQYRAKFAESVAFLRGE